MCDYIGKGWPKYFTDPEGEEPLSETGGAEPNAAPLTPWELRDRVGRIKA